MRRPRVRRNLPTLCSGPRGGRGVGPDRRASNGTNRRSRVRRNLRRYAPGPRGGRGVGPDRRASNGTSRRWVLAAVPAFSACSRRRVTARPGRVLHSRWCRTATSSPMVVASNAGRASANTRHARAGYTGVGSSSSAAEKKRYAARREALAGFAGFAGLASPGFGVSGGPSQLLQQSPSSRRRYVPSGNSIRSSPTRRRLRISR